MTQELINNEVPKHQVLILRPALKSDRKIDHDAGLEEAIGLALTLDLEIVATEIVHLADYNPSTLLGSGKVEEFKGIIAGAKIDLVVIDDQLSPIQQRNLEKAWSCKVIDRTALILEIFGSRARTNEGKLQVELARLEYQKSRLVRTWTHLERQRGGLGKTGGPGERQLEIDRRLIKEKILKIKTQLEKVVKTRTLHRNFRSSVPYPVVALVGYTNAGKSTLFNRLTGSKVYADDKLFATLDPTMRMVKLKSGRQIILSDTVGFISELPTELVAAFRATLEEVQQADLLLHVRDIANPHTELQRKDVLLVLSSLVEEDKINNQMIEVYNKIDMLSPDAQKNLLERVDIMAVSAMKGTNLDGLLESIDKKLGGEDVVLKCKIDISDGRTLAWLHEHGRILKQKNDDNFIKLEVQISQDNLNKYKKYQQNKE